jgi:Transcriptional regulators of sugar metabolism
MIRTLEDYHFDRAFLGTNGFSVDAGYTTPDPEEAAIKSLAIAQANQAYVLSDSSKFSQVSFSRFAALQELPLITNKLSEKETSLLSKYTKIMEAI